MAAVTRTRGELEELRTVIKTFPVIDNHAHNLLLASELENEPFETVTTEARGWALEDTHTSLSHIRAVKQLGELYGCDSGAQWSEVLSKRKSLIEQNYDSLVKRSLEGTHSILIDDGLGGVETTCHPFQWHSQYTTVPCKRILRIETLAESIMRATLMEATEELITDDFLAGVWVIFTSAFEDAIKDAVADENIAGFKSVICYRTGLEVEPDYGRCLLQVGKSFERYATRCVRKGEYRVQSKAVNDFLVVKTMEVLTSVAPAGETSKPVQFHTGLGDNDIELIRSNPAYLQRLIEEYPRVPFVLLHSSWPYTREAAYLATMFKNVFLDLGEVFPMLSRDGQISVVRQAFELAPYSKLLWSTDGHFFPETYWLANKQFREVLEVVMTGYVATSQISETQAIEAVKSILFDNSNRLYRLNFFVPGARRPSSLTHRSRPSLDRVGAGAVTGAAALTGTAIEEQPDLEAGIVDPPISVPGPEDNTAVQGLDSRSLDQHTVAGTTLGYAPVSGSIESTYNSSILDNFLQQHPVKYIYVQWLDYMGTTRCRMFPIAAFSDFVAKGSRFGISRGNVGTLQNDYLTSVVNTTGLVYVEPDLRSLRPTLDNDPLAPAATVFAFWTSEEGDYIEADARGGLVKLLHQLREGYQIHPLIGFEIELTFFRRNANSTDPVEAYVPLTSNHAWSTISQEDYSTALPLISEILTALSSVGIHLLHFHAESGPGQYEFVLLPQQPLAAIDTLYTTRQIIARVAAQHNIRATLHSSPVAGSAGQGAHAHMSLNKAPLVPGPKHQHLFSTKPEDVDAFWAGVLKHLDAICAFTLPEGESYNRVKEDAWSGGTWIAWGTHNRECPLRKAALARWEVRCLDGFANMYLAISAVLAAGLLGLKEREALPKDCEYNPARMSDEERQEYAIVKPMPKSIDESLAALENDTALATMMAESLVRDYITMKKEEQKMLGEMNDDARRLWLIERY